MVLLQRKLTYPRIQRGSNIFQGGGGGPTFSRGKVHINCDFPGGSRPPTPPPPVPAHDHVRRYRDLHIWDEY